MAQKVEEVRFVRTLLLVLLLPLVLAGCGGGKTLAVKKEQIVVMPPEGLWNCPESPEPPPAGYTQKDIADYVLRLYQTNKVCAESLEAVRQYLIQAKELTESDE